MVNLVITKTIRITGSIPNVTRILHSNLPVFDYKIEKVDSSLILTVTVPTEGFLIELLRRLKDKKNRKGTVIEIIDSGDGDGKQ